MRHSPFTVVYDACVFYPAPLRDLLIPPISAEQFVNNMRRQGLPGVADFLEDRIDLI